MTTFQRRRDILERLRFKPGIRVRELARDLGVSEGTIRNDLTALADGGQISRVRGGAVIRHFMSNNPVFAAMARENTVRKDRITRYAASLMADGDSMILDASTTVYHLVPHLQNRKRLTVFTNGIEVALALVANASNTVAIVGGVLHPDGISTTGVLGQEMLRNIHVKKGFLSCSGLAVHQGFTDQSLGEAQIKIEMVKAAEENVILVDSSKFGHVDLTRFAVPEDITRIITDDGISPEDIEAWTSAGVAVVVCSESGVKEHKARR